MDIERYNSDTFFLNFRRYLQIKIETYRFLCMVQPISKAILIIHMVSFLLPNFARRKGDKYFDWQPVANQMKIIKKINRIHNAQTLLNEMRWSHLIIALNFV